MPSKTPGKHTVVSRILRIVGIALSFVVVLAGMIGIIIAAGDPDGPLATTLILSPIVLVLVGILIVKRLRK